MPETEALSAPFASSGLSKISRKEVGSSLSTNDLAIDSNSAPNGDTGGGGLKASIDGAIDKIKERRRKSTDERRRSSDSGKLLSRLVPGSRRRKKRQAALDDQAPTQGSPEGYEDDARRLSYNPSEYSLGLEGSGHSSLLTDDSDNEGKPVRPTLSPHQSHAGYLTLSSPLIKTRATDVAHSPDSSSTARNALDPTEETDESATNAAPPLTERRQSPLGRRLSDAFSRPKKKPVPDSASTKSAASGGAGAGTGTGPGPEGRRGSRSRSLQKLASAQLEAEEGELQEGETQEAETQEEAKRRSRALSTASRVPVLDRPRRIDTARPATPPQQTGSTVTTPSTLVTPPTPTISSPPSPDPASPSKSSLTPTTTRSTAPASPKTPTASRGRKTGPLPASKLSNALSASPLTPTLEETKTPGGSFHAPATSGAGFFSSFVSAAQNAANQLSTSINTTIAANQKTRQSAPELVPAAGGEQLTTPPKAPSEEVPPEKRELAVETLGSGNLSLSHLGIADSPDHSPMASAVDLTDKPSLGLAVANHGDDAQKAEETAAARAVSVAYERPAAQLISQAQGGRPGSVVSADLDGEAGDDNQTPPRSSLALADFGVTRSGSVRSKISSRTRRHRGSSAAGTGMNTLAAAISASTAAIAHPGSAASGPGHRLTGFAVASSKRNKDFHQFFRSVPEDDYLIEDYSAALQRDILLHGRLYVSEGHICFSSNILGWVTNLVISFDEIVSVEKKSTAVIFPNAIVIQTLHARNTFASLVARDSTYDLLVGIWKISHPDLKSSVNGVALDDSGTGDKTEKAELSGSEDDSEDGSDDVYDEDEDEDEEAGSFTEAGRNGSIAGSDVGEIARAATRKVSTMPVSAVTQSSGAPPGLQTADAVVTGAAITLDHPGPQTHAPTECGDQDTHYDKPLCDLTIPAPLGKVYSIMFGPASGVFMKKWLVEEQKSRELVYEDDKFGLDDTHRTMTYSYIKPLNAPVGPRQTKCISTFDLKLYDLDKAVVVNASTQTPDVPSGNIFTTKTKYCLMWGPDNSTRMIANCTIEWTGKSWLKSPIEKGANDGQTQYIKDIVAAIKAAVTTKPPVKGATRGKSGKGRRRRGETFGAAGTEAERSADAVKADEAANRGLWAYMGPLEPLAPILKPLFTAQVAIAALCLLLAYTWLFGARAGGSGLGFPIRYAAYEEIWRKEESELWDWLQDRVGVERGAQQALLLQQRGAGGGNGAGDGDKSRQKALRSSRMGRDLVDEKLGARQVDDAIRITEERLGVLKDAVKKGKSRSQSQKERGG